MTAPKNFLSATQPNTPLVGQDGRLTLEWMQWFRRIGQAGNAVDQQGNIQAPILPTTPLAVRGVDLGTLLQHITDLGLLDSLTSIAADVNTDHIADGSGNPLAGGAAAYAALLASSPALNNILQYNGTHWLPAALAAGVASLDAITGAITLVAGSGITIADNTPGAGQITISSSAVSGSYVKGTISFPPQAGAGTYQASGTVTGVSVTLPPQVVTVGVANSTEAGIFSNLLGWVSGTNTVTIQATSNAAFLGVTLSVVVFN